MYCQRIEDDLVFADSPMASLKVRSWHVRLMLTTTLDGDW